MTRFARKTSTWLSATTCATAPSSTPIQPSAREADAYQTEAEARFPYTELRAKLLTRREGR